MSAHRRPLATAAAAAGALFALGFVPSAQASPDSQPGREREPASASAPVNGAASHAAATAEEIREAADPGAVAGPRLNPDAGPDSLPYVLGAVGLAGAGGLLAARARAVRLRR